MRCVCCDAETDFVDIRDNKPVCEECSDIIREINEFWFWEGWVFPDQAGELEEEETGGES